jgi:lysozyme
MGRKRKTVGWRARIAALAALVLMIGGGWFWWQVQHWVPSEAEFPDQGAEISAADGAINFRTLRALGADFVYLDASRGAKGEDARFSKNLAAARAAGLQVGAVHVFDPCAMADGQSANFVTMVPRGTGLLPPAIALDRTADDCPTRVGEAAVESELMTLINQIESHAGRPVILKITPDFESRYGLAGRLERNLWLVRTRFRPGYAGRPWLLWTANRSLRSEAAEDPIRWVVVQP